MSTAREELGSVWRPQNMVLAILPGPDQSEPAARELRDAGFHEQRVTVLRAGEGVEELDIEGKRREHKGVGRALHAAWAYLSVEGPEMRDYEEASEGGQDVIAVKVAGGEEVARVRDVLSRSGATRIRYFTRWNVSTLSSEPPAA